MSQIESEKSRNSEFLIPWTLRLLPPVIGGCCTATVFTIVLTQVLKFEIRLQYYILPIIVGIVFGLVFTKIKATSILLQHKNNQLEEAINRVKSLEGLLQICSICKNIRVNDDEWNAIEAYIQRHSLATFSHGLCPGCLDKQLANNLKV